MIIIMYHHSVYIYIYMYTHTHVCECVYVFVTLVTHQDIWDYARNFSKLSNQSAFSNVSSTPMTQRWDRSADAWVQQSAMGNRKRCFEEGKFHGIPISHDLPTPKKNLSFSQSVPMIFPLANGKVGSSCKALLNCGASRASRASCTKILGAKSLIKNASIYIMGIWWVYNQYNQSSLVTTGWPGCWWHDS